MLAPYEFLVGADTSLSFFGRQQGDFGLHILSIAACSSPDSAGNSPAATSR